jgi:BolA protein
MTLYSRETIETKLTAAFAPNQITVIDESHLHAGHHHGASDHHAGFDGSSGTHFRVMIVSSAFAGLSRIDRHRAVNKALAEELAAGVHALAIEAKAPGEPTRR